MTSAGFLGRFQPLHRGHAHVIDEYREEFDEFRLIVGSADKKRTEKNPLSFEERKNLIHDCYPDIEVIALEDTEKDEDGNREWAGNLEELDLDVIITQNELVKSILAEHTDMEVIEQEFHDKDIYSGTEVRRRIKSKEEWRYLTPDCAKERIEEFLETIRDSGIEYDFEPGWEPKNAYHGTADK
ncbi:MAG: adenylyltransferase/cytidyltransferase family protein [Candidatus Nanohaloarchaea archaeon]